MHNPAVTLPGLVLLLVSLLPAAVSADPLRVFVSVLPMRTVVERIGGEHVDVRVMVQPGYDPVTYDATPQQIAALAEADLYVRVGVPFENAWMQRIRSANPAMPILDARSGIAPRDRRVQRDDHRPGGVSDEPRHDERHHDHDSDPHIWTDPRLVMHVAGVIRDQLAQLAPAQHAEFIRNHAAFVGELQRLDEDIRALLEPLQNRRFLVFHPAWGYFADAYGLTQISIEHDGKQPGARALAKLIDQAKRESIRVVFVQSQFDRRQAEQVAEAIGGHIIAADPLAADYVDNMRRVARQFAEALQP